MDRDLRKALARQASADKASTQQLRRTLRTALDTPEDQRSDQIKALIHNHQELVKKVRKITKIKPLTLSTTTVECRQENICRIKSTATGSGF